jgi:hypothetical protein
MTDTLQHTPATPDPTEPSLRAEITVIVRAPDGREVDRQAARMESRSARGRIIRPVG